MSDSTSTSKTTSEKSTTKDSGTTSSESSSTSSETNTTSKSSSGGGGGARPISYFSSVSTDEYRSGWDNIFSAGNGTKRPSSPRRPAARKPKAPLTIELSLDDLSPELRAGLEAAARAKAKGKRVNYDRRAQAGAVDWRLVCEIKR